MISSDLNIYKQFLIINFNNYIYKQTSCALKTRKKAFAGKTYEYISKICVNMQRAHFNT